jgi:hypothetical protein
MNYSQIDKVILNWVEKHNFSLFTNHENIPDSDFRAVYLSSKQGECCQISIDKPKSGKVCIHAGDIETDQDEVLKKEWCVPIEELEKALEKAVNFVKIWFCRKSA